MKSSLDYEKEIDEIRARLCKEYEEMGSEAWHRKLSEDVHEAAKKYGFKIIPSQSGERFAA